MLKIMLVLGIATLVVLYFYLDYQLNKVIIRGLWRGGRRLVAAYGRRRAQKRSGYSSSP